VILEKKGKGGILDYREILELQEHRERKVTEEN